MSNLIAISGKINSGKDATGTIIQGLNMSLGLDVILHQLNLNKSFEATSGFEIKKFADIIKDIVCLFIGCTREQLEDEEFKNKELEEEWWYYTNSLFYSEDKELIPYNEANKATHNSTQWYIIKLTPRKLMQLIGTECGRNIIHPNIWVNALMSGYKTDRSIREQTSMETFRDIPTDLTKPAHRDLMKAYEISEKVSILPNWIITDLRFPNELQAIKDRGGLLIRINRSDENGMAIKSGYHHISETALDYYTDWDYVIENDGSIEDLIGKVQRILLNERIL